MRHQSRGPGAREVWHFDFSTRPAPAELESYYWVNDGQLSRAFGSSLPPRLADLVDLTMAVYYADRRAVRARNPYALTGQRDFSLRLPVRDLELWSGDEVGEELTDLLYWYTEDRWSFTFTPHQSPPRPSEAEQYLFPSPVRQPAVTVLFSGGLDSLAGLVAQLERYRDHSFVLLSGCTHDRLAAIQHDLVTHLRRAWHNSSRELISIRVPFGIRKLKGTAEEEKSQRSRGFVFLVLGAVAAAMARSQCLWVHENGIGAVNLWLNEGQLGVDNARGVHPLSLIRMAEFLGLILQQPLQIKNPCQFSTKAQMCQALKRLGLADLIPRTVSCDSFPLRIRGVPQCGLCTSCLLRRVALHAAGLEHADPNRYYRYDVSLALDEIDVRTLYPLRVTLDHVDRLGACLASDAPWEMLTEAFPELLEIQAEMVRHDGGNPQAIADAYVQMYRTYVKEWERFPVGSLAMTASR
jgi:7-cyano-7-deazaguanine synthase in queuosine biosynthesis